MTPSHPTGTEAVGLWTRLRVAYGTDVFHSCTVRFTKEGQTIPMNREVGNTDFCFLLRLTFGLWIIRCVGWVFSFTVSLGVGASCIFVFVRFILTCWIRKPNTLPETNRAPENGWLEEDISFMARPIFRGKLLVLGRVIFGHIDPPINQLLDIPDHDVCCCKLPYFRLRYWNTSLQNPWKNSFSSCLTPRF